MLDIGNSRQTGGRRQKSSDFKCKSPSIFLFQLTCISSKTMKFSAKFVGIDSRVYQKNAVIIKLKFLLFFPGQVKKKGQKLSSPDLQTYLIGLKSEDELKTK